MRGQRDHILSKRGKEFMDFPRIWQELGKPDMGASAAICRIISRFQYAMFHRGGTPSPKKSAYLAYFAPGLFYLVWSPADYPNSIHVFCQNRGTFKLKTFKGG